MTNRYYDRFILGTAVAAVCPGLAIADVTADQVWETWKSYGESYGQQITAGSEERNGDTLTLRDVKMAYTFPEGTASGSLELLEMTERADGTVSITMSPDFPMALSAVPEEGDEVDITLIARHSGLNLVAAGDENSVRFNYVASTISVDFERFFVGGESLDPTLGMMISDVSGFSSVTEGDPRLIDSEMNADAMSFDVAFTDPENGGAVNFKGEFKDISSQSSGSVPDGFDSSDPSVLFSSGFAVTGGLDMGASSFSMDVQDGSDSFTLAGGSQTSAINFDLSDGNLAYGTSTTGTQYSISSPQLPFPSLTFAVAQSEFQFGMPMVKSDEPREIRFVTKLVDWTVDDMLWDMVDAGQVLPRDPASIIVDVTGAMNWLINISDPEEAAALEEAGGTPAELHELTLNELKLSAAGAEVSGTGAFTFDNTDLDTFDGMPAPTGTVNLTIQGANGLLDNLTAMGLLPQEQAMGARMMLGLFARPEGGPDTLVSTIEVNGDGSVFANGQQLQ